MLSIRTKIVKATQKCKSRHKIARNKRKQEKLAEIVKMSPYKFRTNKNLIKVGAATNNRNNRNNDRDRNRNRNR